jgi:hypothetical protein
MNNTIQLQFTKVCTFQYGSHDNSTECVMSFACCSFFFVAIQFVFLASAVKYLNAV